MNTILIGKTIIVYNRLSDIQVIELVNSLKEIILTCRKNILFDSVNTPIPITIPNHSYLCVIKKHNEILLSVTKNKERGIEYLPILNGDELYKYISIIKNSPDIINNRINMLSITKNVDWVKLPYNKAFEDYAMTPNINPQDFIKHLQSNSLSEFQKHFLTQVGISLDSPQYSSNLQNTINKANEIFERD